MNIRRHVVAIAARCRAIIRYDLRTEIAQSSGVVLGGRLLQLAFGLVSSALLARALGPAGLSTFALVGALLAIATTFADFGLRNSVVRHVAGDLAGRPDSAHRIAGTYARLKLLVGSAVAAGMVLLAGPIAMLLNFPAASGPAYVWLAALGLLAATLSDIPSTLLRALRRFPAFVAAQMLNTGLTVALFAALFLLGRLTISSGLVVGAVTALAAAGLGFTLLPAGWRATVAARGSLRNTESRRLLSFSRWLWMSAILSILYAQLDLILLSQWLAPALVGLYALALNLTQKVGVVNQTLHTVLLPAVSALSTREAYIDYIRRSFIRSLMLAVPVALSLLLAPPFIVLVYGTSFAGSVGVFRLLILLAIFELLVGPLLLLAFPMNMPRVIATADAVRVVVLFVVGTLAIPAWGLHGAVVAKFAGAVSGALVTGIAIIRQLQVTPTSAADGEKSPDTDIVPAPLPPDAT